MTKGVVMGDHPREGLFRMVEWRAADAAVDSSEVDGRLGTFHGYAAIFDADTEINSWEGRFVERIAPGAFRRTLEHRGDKVKALFNHGFDPQIGDKPLGKIEALREDDRGLYVEFGLDDTSYNRDLVASLRSGAIDGMSFQFSVAQDEWDHPDEGLPVRTLREVKLYEVGPVTFPAYEATEVGIRSREAFAAWRQAGRTGEDGPAAGTPSEPSDDPAEATRRHKKQAEQARRRLGLTFKEIKKETKNGS